MTAKSKNTNNRIILTGYVFLFVYFLVAVIVFITQNSAFSDRQLLLVAAGILMAGQLANLFTNLKTMRFLASKPKVPPADPDPSRIYFNPAIPVEKRQADIQHEFFRSGDVTLFLSNKNIQGISLVYQRSNQVAEHTAYFDSDRDRVVLSQHVAGSSTSALPVSPARVEFAFHESLSDPKQITIVEHPDFRRKDLVEIRLLLK